jgi:hypothetical protein
VSSRGLSFLRRHGTFLILLALVAGLRMAILVRAETHVHSDEAIIGMMGTRILEGTLRPIFMRGQPYNGGAAMEAYLAAGSFALLGPGVIPLRIPIVALSLLSLVALYAVVRRFWDPRTAVIAAAIYAVAPSLLKWHFQVRGYAFHLLSVPVLFGLFLLVLQTRPRTFRFHLALGLVAGLSLWCLEIVLPVVLATALLLVLRRGISPGQAVAGLAGTVLGYSPALLYNLSRGFANWAYVAARKQAGAPATPDLSLGATAVRILFTEMPRFFGADTVLWYFPETSAVGIVYAVVAAVSVALSLWSVRRRLAGFVRDHLVMKPGPSSGVEDRLLYAMVFLGASSCPYLLARFREPRLLIGGYGFVAVMVGSALGACLASRRAAARSLGACTLGVLVFLGLYEAASLYRNGGIETLVMSSSGDVGMKKIPDRDLDGVFRELRSEGIRFVTASPSFQYPILFESGETIHASAAAFGSKLRLFPEVERPRPEDAADAVTLVFESGMPVGRFIEMPRPADFGDRWTERRFGSLTVIHAVGPGLSLRRR